ncbi:MAG: hypothetical protein GQ574_12405 [Crocinitomix sp.]|nr:hypothetical protein [Crocinitomix sp.]
MSRFLFFILIISFASCEKDVSPDELKSEYQCDCNSIKDTLTFSRFSTIKDTNFIIINAPIDSINQLILDSNIRPFEKAHRDGMRQLWWHKGHPIKLQSTNSGILYDRIFEKTFYIFDNCAGAMEIRKLDTLQPNNLLENQRFFYENRQPNHLFVRARTPNGITNDFQSISHNKYAQDGALGGIELFKQYIEFYGFYYYN